MSLRTIPILAVALGMAGCSFDHKFSLADLDALTIGKSSRAEVEARLGLPERYDYALPHAVYQSGELKTKPPFPLSLITWPLIFGNSRETYRFVVRYDDLDVLERASLTIEGDSRAFLLLLIQPHFLAPELGPERLDQLRRLEAKGIPVAIEAYFEQLSIEEYEAIWARRPPAPK